MIKKINILGYGTMGRHLAAFFHAIGYQVTVWNRTLPEYNDKKYLVEKRLFEKKFGGKSDSGTISFVTDLNELSDELTLEALTEDLLIKQDVIGRLPFDICRDRIFTNSSSIAPHEIHSRIEAMHFFNPLYAVPLVETTTSNPRMSLFEDMIDVGIILVPVKNNRGFVGNYILFREIAAALNLIEAYGYDAATIDRVMNTLGRHSSIFDIIDFVGVDITKLILENLRAQDSSISVPSILGNAISAGILGRKNKTTIRELLGVVTTVFQ